jgi:hypothetical protein
MLFEDFANFFDDSLDLYQFERGGISATFNDLPAELLERIFFFATEFRYSYLTLDEAARILLNICRVCHYWRAVALSVPELWGRLINITGFSYKRLNSFLELSDPRQIEVFLDGGPNYSVNRQLSDIQDRFTHVLSELSRISYLVIRRFHLTRKHHSCLSKLAPALQVFSFEGHGSKLVHFPFPLFKEAVELRSLHLDAATIDFEGATYPNLIELRVRDIQDPFSPLISTWITFLTNHPFLQSLTLSHVVSIQTSDLVVPLIHLDQLQQFTLADDATQCAQLLSRIIMPNTCCINLLCGFDNNDGLRMLQNTVSMLMAPRLSGNLQVTLSGTSIVFSNAIQNQDNLPLTQSGGPFSFKFQWQSMFWPFQSSGLPERPFRFLSDAGLQGLEALNIDLFPINGRCPLDDDDLLCTFREWLGGLSSVKHLILGTNSAYTIFDLINDHDDEPGDNKGEGGLIFPLLEGLELADVEGEELDWGAFVSFAEYRYHAKRALKQIIVAKAELDHLHWNDVSEIADLGLEINLK